MNDFFDKAKHRTWIISPALGGIPEFHAGLPLQSRLVPCELTVDVSVRSSEGRPKLCDLISRPTVDGRETGHIIKVGDEQPESMEDRKLGVVRWRCRVEFIAPED